jgi:RHS repeat-associated protein
MRVGSTLSYLFGDHLGSTAITADSNGAKTAEVRYAAWGSDRYIWGTTPTTYRFTGQRLEASFGLYFYNARWFDPLLGRWAQADTVTEEGVQGLDRYAYALNNPLKYTDPSGHDVCDEEGNCYGRYRNYQAPKTGTPIPYVGFSSDYIKVLIVLIAMESSSGKVPDNVNSMKAWALLNLRSFHQTSGLKHYRRLTPFEDWKNHERPLLYEQGISGGIENQVAQLLKLYEKYKCGLNGILAEAFDSIEAGVIQASIEWYAYGPNSMADPVNGATGFWDAAGLRYPEGKATDPLLRDIPNYQTNIMSNPLVMERFRNVFSSPLVVSQVYPIDNIYNFTVFHGPFAR